MAEPTIHPELQILGVKIATIVAGFFGGVVSLSFIRGLTKVQSALAVSTGVAVAYYLTPVVEYYLNLPTSLSNAAAFLLGLTAMNLVPGVLKLSMMFKRDPLGTIKVARGGEDGR